MSRIDARGGTADVRAVLLTGGLGAGKTTVAIQVVELSESASVSVVAIDLDWLAWMWSPTLDDDGVHELLCANLAAIVPNFLARGATRVVLARAVLAAADVQRLADVLAGVPLSVVRLSVDPDEAERRLRSRDSVGGVLAEHLSEMRQFDALVAAAVPDAPIVMTDGRTPDAIAREVMALVGWDAPAVS